MNRLNVHFRRIAIGLVIVTSAWSVSGVALSQPNPVSLSAAKDPEHPASDLPVGKWKVEFTNGVIETCIVRPDRLMSVVEPLRASAGQIKTTNSGALLVIFEDDRAERWTRCGQRMIVEHWFPASQFPPTAPVLGIGQLGFAQQ